MASSASDDRGRAYGAPRVPTQLVTRQRLLARLDEPAALLVVRGPAGSGKTVLLADWANRGDPRDAERIWITVDESTSGRLAFWRAVVQTMSDAGMVPEGSVLASVVPALDTTPDLTALLVRAFTQWRRDLVIIVDDVHLLSDEAIVSDVLRVVAACPGVRFIVATRSLGPFEASAAGLRVDTAVVPPEQLLFTVDETRSVLELAGVTDAATLAREVHGLVGGMPVSTRAVVLGLGDVSLSMSADIVGEAARRAVDAFLVRELGTGGDNDRLLGFMVMTSLPEVLTPELARELSGLDDAEQLIAEAERRGMGLRTHESFSYTTVIRGVLMERLEREHAPELSAMRRTIAEWALRNDLPFLAFKLAIEIGDLEWASSMAPSRWMEFIAFHSDGLYDVLRTVPTRKLQRYPFLTMILALRYNATGRHRMRAIELFGLAIVGVKMYAARAEPGDRVVMYTLEGAALRVTGRAEAAAKSAERAEALIEELPPETWEALGPRMHSMLFAQNGLSWLYSGNASRAIVSFERGYASLSDDTWNSRFHNEALLAGVHAIAGDYPQAIPYLAAIDRSEWPEGWTDGYAGALYQIAHALRSLEEFDFEAAQSRIDVMDRHRPTIEHWTFFEHVQAYIDLGQGRARGRATALEAALARGGRPPISAFARLRIEMTLALLLLASGQGTRVDALLKKHPENVPAVAIMWARRHLLANRPDLAIRHLLDVPRESSSRTIVEALIVRAATALRLDNPALALSSLDDATALAADRGLYIHFMTIPRRDLDALRELSDARGPSQASEVIDRLVGMPDVMPASLSMATLTDRELIVLAELVKTGHVEDLAATLFVSSNTIKSQLRSVYRKLGVRTREEALLAASEQGLLAGS
ncbi:LuxR C-terminal-related transcriptional regulator [Compostimonas suwonensis]|uniref:LuxR family maltose regulon positive regulatory protein n=1 Tax=Compostimonas suwonensis TaxID=1048394 RepID=A0A2M9C4K4_9MICO|nr:LuxR C-terminal-related transcriptional regulator [Compostimonas suwonensis]PJJ65458.1 LuxR family maltose regulon positive regulatory protein [Compostimonas suwonensis]